MQLTERQQEVLDFIVTFQKEHGYSPTQREIAAEFCWSGPAAAFAHIKALAKKGALSFDKRRARSITIGRDNAVQTIWGKFEVGS